MDESKAPEPARARRGWTDTECMFVLRNFYAQGREECARALQRGDGAIAQKYSELLAELGLATRRAAAKQTTFLPPSSPPPIPSEISEELRVMQFTILDLCQRVDALAGASGPTTSPVDAMRARLGR